MNIRPGKRLHNSRFLRGFLSKAIERKGGTTDHFLPPLYTPSSSWQCFPLSFLHTMRAPLFHYLISSNIPSAFNQRVNIIIFPLNIKTHLRGKMLFTWEHMFLSQNKHSKLSKKIEQNMGRTARHTPSFTETRFFLFPMQKDEKISKKPLLIHNFFFFTHDTKNIDFS